MPVPPFLNNLAGLNAVASAKGGILTYLNEISALNAIDVIEAGAGGYLNGLSALNSIDVLLGGSGGYLNELDVLNSIVVLEGGVGGHLNTIGAINEWVDNAGEITYELLATWDEADDQLYTNGQDLDTSGEGVEDGLLKLAMNDGVVEVVSNEVKIGLQSTPAFSDEGWVSQAVLRSRGKAFFFSYYADDTINLINFLTSATLPVITTGAENADAGMFFDYRTPTIRILSQANAVNGPVIGTLQQGVLEDFCIVLGGFDGELPWYIGAGFPDGNFLFKKIGGVWTLLWTDFNGTAATLYAAGNFNGATAGGATFSKTKNWKVPNRNYSLVQVPSHFSTFDAVDGTQVESVTPEVGAAFLAKNGSAHVQSNKATNDGAVPGGAGLVYTSETGESDIFLTDTINPAVGESAGICARYTDNDNFWALHVDEAANTLILYERVAGSYVSRATIAVTIIAGVDYDLTFILDGTTLTGFVNRDDRITFTSVVGQTKTEHGFTILTAGTTHDNFVGRPVRSSVYDTELNNN